MISGSDASVFLRQSDTVGRAVLRTLLGILVVALEACSYGQRSAPTTARPNDPNSVLITLERTACYGICPVYTVSIDGNGTVRYQGGSYIDIPGVQTAKIDANRITALLRQFDKINFFALQPSYSGDCTDGPTEIISLSVDGHTKQVSNYFCHDRTSGPQVDLLSLGLEIDSVAGTLRWIHCDSGCFKEQIGHGLDVNGASKSGFTTLMRVIQRKDLDSTRLFLDAGAKVNVSDDRGYTPLMFAAMENSPEIVQELLAHGADVHAKDKTNHTVLDMVGRGKVWQLLRAAAAKP